LKGPIIIAYSTYTSDVEWLAYDAAAKKTQEVGFSSPVPAGYSDVVTERFFVPSLDGKAHIPMELIHARDVARDGTAPTILQAYGAYGIVTSPGVTTPGYDPTTLAWLERGGVLAHAMVRGGGEYGEDWHLAARLQKKPFRATISRHAPGGLLNMATAITITSASRAAAPEGFSWG
jgi:prolyl oligopeptidase